MIINGKQVASDIESELKKISSTQRKTLGVVVVGDDPASISYTNRKKIVGENLGVHVELFHFEETVSTDEVVARIKALNSDERIDGVIAQLPLPSSLDTEEILNSVSPEKDVDALSKDSEYYAPVAHAIRRVLEIGGVKLEGKEILVVGQGRLVGAPTTKWLDSLGLDVVTADINTENLDSLTLTADVIISGAGSPRLIKPDMIKRGVVLIDAGTSEDSGRIVGDIDPECVEKCSLFTPVPGGIGPIAVVMLFRNLLHGPETN